MNKGLAAAIAGLAILGLHASIVVALLAATAPAWRPQSGQRSPLGVWLIAPPNVVSTRGVVDARDTVSGLACAQVFDVDQQGNVYDIGRPSRAFLRSLPAGRKAPFARIGIPCPSTSVPSLRAWSKRDALPPGDLRNVVPPDPFRFMVM